MVRPTANNILIFNIAEISVEWDSANSRGEELKNGT